MLLSEPEHTHQSSFQLIRDWLTHKQSFPFTTSGSTGIPKSIELSRTQLEASAQATIDALSLTANDHVLVCLNTSFIGGAMLIIRALMAGASITLQEPSGNPLQYLSTKHPYTFVSFAPMQLFPVLQNTYAEKAKLSRFNTVLIGGGGIDASLEKELITLNTKTYHTYGMTETVSHIALKELGKQQFFEALPGVQLRTDHRSCLAICCAATDNEWVQTNDVVELNDTHSFHILGRADDVINSGGIKIWPATVEQALREIPGFVFTNICVFGIPDAKLGERLIAVIETQKPDEHLLSSLSQQLESRLSKYEIPRQYFTLPTFSYTPTGKINKAETLKMIAL